MNISISNIDMVYPSGKKALCGINASIESPSLIGLLGPNGAGKTTLMKLLVAGLLPSSGQITLDGLPLIKNEGRLKSSLGYLPQHFGLYDELTVWQFLDYMAALKQIKNAKGEIAAALRDARLETLQKKRIGTLSGGQRQRVGIAQALLGDPEFLIFDEPTVGLDPEERINFRNLFSRTAREKIVLLSTHIIEDIQSICNRIIVLNHGRILFDGAPAELIRRAQGHVGTFEETRGAAEFDGMQITARVNTARGVACRVVADSLPAFVHTAEPTLEDAYMYMIGKEGAAI